MVDSISGSGNVPKIQQVNRAQSNRTEDNKAERAEAREIKAQELDETQAEAAAKALSGQLAENKETTLSNGNILDELL